MHLHTYGYATHCHSPLSAPVCMHANIFVCLHYYVFVLIGELHFAIVLVAREAVHTHTSFCM